MKIKNYDELQNILFDRLKNAVDNETFEVKTDDLDLSDLDMKEIAKQFTDKDWLLMSACFGVFKFGGDKE